jgi:hypothetical protein
VGQDDVTDRLHTREAHRLGGVDLLAADGLETCPLDLRQIGACVERHPETDCLEGAEHDADVGEGEIEKEDLNEERRVKKESYIAAHDCAQHAGAVG